MKCDGGRGTKWNKYYDRVKDFFKKKKKGERKKISSQLGEEEWRRKADRKIVCICIIASRMQRILYPI